MPKIIKDLKKGKKLKKINLKVKRFFKNALPLVKRKNCFYKNKTPIKKIQDISSKEEAHYIYIEGGKYNPPKFLGNLLSFNCALNLSARGNFLSFIIVCILEFIDAISFQRHNPDASHLLRFKFIDFLRPS